MRYSLAFRSPVQRNDAMILLLNIARYLRVLWRIRSCAVPDYQT
jgi:hypothetical protein